MASMRFGLKTRVKSYKDSRNLIKLFVYAIFSVGWFCIKLVGSSYYRSLLWLRFTRSAEIHQIHGFTKYDRYPTLFNTCRDYFSSNHAINILSYGCSTGEEVFTLKEIYFPHAKIVGAEINKRSLSICKKRNRNGDIHFVYPDQQLLVEKGPYDIIFCLAVLQNAKNRLENTTSSKDIYPFEKFNCKITELDKLLTINGLMVITNADYYFLDTDVAKKYKVIETEIRPTNRPYFGKDNLRVADGKLLDSIFLKIIS